MKSCALCMTLCLTSASLPHIVKADGSVIENGVLQSSLIRGVVKDSNGDPLLGVNVIVKGSTIGAVTDIDGNFSFEAPAGSILVVSYIGFKSQEIKVKGNTPLNIILKEDSEALDEVVVVGYGVQKKSDVTGALSSVKGDELTKLSISRTDQALQGQMAGVMVQNSVAAPGEEPNIIIRGGNSLKGDNAPLVVIDGVLGGDLSLIDPNDITSIEVLKDASSTSIYGSRGANGAIMVTTKRGSTGKPSVSYSGYVSVSQVSKKMDMLNGQELYDLLKEAQENYPTSALKIPSWVDPNNLNNTDWQDEVFRSAPMTGHSLSVSGGTETTKYSLSGNYLLQQGIIKNSDFNRAGVRANVEQKLGKNVTVGMLLNASRSSSTSASINQMNGSDGGGVTFSALGFGPLVPIYKEDGSFSGPLKDGAQMNNPVALINDQVVDKDRSYFQGTAFLEWEILKGLRFRTAWSYTYSDKRQRQFTSGENLLSYKGQGYAYVENKETTNWLGENTLTYSKTFNKDHSLNVVAGFTAEASDYFYNTSSGKGFDIESLGYWNMGLADNSLLSVGSGETILRSLPGWDV
ncbi:SusC/RagA family TonB-linked outer membrane protein [Parabacteroides sp. HGS0025]|nr:SusC/RagA family TonB-linked outer membrane protein [Parabacteroides sp. HGS0025]